MEFAEETKKQPVLLLFKTRSNRSGVTIVELMAAVVMAAALAGMVYFAWGAIHRHATNSGRKALFEVEALSLSRAIATQIRKSLKVLSLQSNGITFISHINYDTVQYRFYAGELVRNGSRVEPALAMTRIDQFMVSVVEKGVGPTGPAALVELKFEMSDTFGNHSTLRRYIATDVPGSMQEDGISEWKF